MDAEIPSSPFIQARHSLQLNLTHFEATNSPNHTQFDTLRNSPTNSVNQQKIDIDKARSRVDAAIGRTFRNNSKQFFSSVSSELLFSKNLIKSSPYNKTTIKGGGGDFDTTAQTVLSPSQLPQIKTDRRTIDIQAESNKRIENIKKTLPQSVRDSLNKFSSKTLRQKSILIDMNLIKQNVYRNSTKG